MNLGQLRVELQSRGFDGFSAEDLTRYINWGYFDFARRLRLQEVEESVAFTLNAGQYRQTLSGLPVPAKSIRHVVLTTTDKRQKLEPVSEATFWNDWAPYGFAVAGSTIDAGYSGTPTNYYILDAVCVILPCPDVTHTFLAQTWSDVTELVADADEPITSIKYEEGLLLNIIRVCHVRANELDRSTESERRVIRFIEECLNESSFQGTEEQEQTEPYVI